MRTPILPIALLLSCVPATASANLRAPITFDKSPSSAVLSTPASGLVVLGEQLTFRCEATHACEVSATYQVEVAEAVEVELAFIAPSDVTIAARVGEVSAPVTTVPTSRFDPEQHKRLPWELQEATLYEARFRASLVKGRNAIHVSYEQPLSSFETDYGYWRDGRYVDVLRYEVWPLWEWTLADDFALDLTLSIRREPPGWWTRNFGTWTDANCVAQGVKVAPMERRSRKDTKGWYVQTWRLGSDLPERIECYRADDDIVPG